MDWRAEHEGAKPPAEALEQLRNRWCWAKRHRADDEATALEALGRAVQVVNQVMTEN